MTLNNSVSIFKIFYCVWSLILQMYVTTIEKPYYYHYYYYFVIIIIILPEETCGLSGVL